MPESDGRSLWIALSAAGDLTGRFLWGDTAEVALRDLVAGSSLGGQREALRGRSVLLATRHQLTAALALIELDGLARRMVLCPPDLPSEHLHAIMATAEIDAVVSDRTEAETGAAAVGCFVTCAPRVAPMAVERSDNSPTEWILLTSGTTGVPKLVVHSLAGLAGPTRAGAALGRSAVWSKIGRAHV